MELEEENGIINCSICLFKPKNPILLTCCEHVFCKECINTWRNSKLTCPLCKSSSYNTVNVTRLLNELNEEFISKIKDKDKEIERKTLNLRNGFFFFY
jgi:SUMO ligase MMS21 Smc5/6 complex component